MIITLSSRELATALLGPDCKPNSWQMIERKARQGEIPGIQVGRKWRFLEEEIKKRLARGVR